MGARKLAEKEQIDIRLYSVIYQAIEELKSAMEGMLSPEIKEEIIANGRSFGNLQNLQSGYHRRLCRP